MKVLCFGTFDGVHDGHRAMLREAKSLGGYLVVAIAPDPVAKKLKGVAPKHTSGQRIEMLKKEKIADEVVLCDEKTSSWQILKKYKPSIIALGYDQHELRSNLENYLETAYPETETEEGFQTNPKKPRIVVLSAYKPETHHNSLLAS
jgi:cytidyltransferase-like protein